MEEAVCYWQKGGYCFINLQLQASDFIETLVRMNKANRYKQMVIFVESCLSGSMFKHLLPEDMNSKQPLWVRQNKS